jgi:predicted AAA+ superfamily ATPase
MPSAPYTRPFVRALAQRLAEPRRHIQILAGPRQVGKTTGALQALAHWNAKNAHFASADDVNAPDDAWLRSQWALARDKAGQGKHGAVLVVDEVQRVKHWSTAVKGLWDQDSRQKTDLKVVLLGSSALMLAKGLTESLAGRFEPLPVGHWSFAESRQAFGWGLREQLLFGGYPGPAAMVKDPARWRAQVREALVEPALNRDVLATALVEKPALLRRLFTAACQHAAQVVSYNKLLGQLTDRGNVTILSHYQTLLEHAWLIVGLQKYSGSVERSRASSPKWLPLAPALLTAVSDLGWQEWEKPGEARGQLVEATVGAHLAEQCRRRSWKLWYWREGNDEVDYVVQGDGQLWAVEVKSGRARNARGLTAFLKRYPKARPLIVEGDRDLEAFLMKDLA